jgi:hypothetical protein
MEIFTAFSIWHKIREIPGFGPVFPSFILPRTRELQQVGKIFDILKIV